MPVYADLNALVRRHPGWPSVAQYDLLLSQLDRAARQSRAGVGRQFPVLTLPAQPGVSLPGGAFAAPATALAQEQRHLARQQQAQVVRLRLRRDRSRRQQIALQEDRWRREARLRYARAVQAANARFAQRFQAAFTADSAERINLTLQTRALRTTVADWGLSKPPSPRLSQAVKDLKIKSARLALLGTQQAGALAGIRRDRDVLLAQAAADRAGYVDRQHAQLARTLLAQDQAAVATERTLLSRQTASLLRQERTLAVAATAAGPLSAVALSGAASGATPGHGLEAAEGHLRAQRAHWISLLYDDTRAAAQEAARQRGWTVAFGPSHRGEPDRTNQLAALLASRIWKS